MYLVINRLDVGFDVQPDLFKNMEFKISFEQVQETNYKRVVEAVKKLQTRVLTLVDDDTKYTFEESRKIFLESIAHLDKSFIENQKDAVKDGWNNKNVDLETSLEVTIDNVKPEIKEVKAVNDKPSAIAK